VVGLGTDAYINVEGLLIGCNDKTTHIKISISIHKIKNKYIMMKNIERVKIITSPMKL
jgi:hypothetical protein